MEELNKTISVDSKQYICVKLGTQHYGIDIHYVYNVVRMQKVTRVPKAQLYFTDVITLRGEIVPVMSLSLQLDLYHVDSSIPP